MGYTIKVETLKRVLKRSLESLEEFDDNQEVNLVSNTYFLNGASYFLGVSGVDGGYLDLRRIPENVVEDDECDGDCSNCDNEDCEDREDNDSEDQIFEEEDEENEVDFSSDNKDEKDEKDD